MCVAFVEALTSGHEVGDVDTIAEICDRALGRCPGVGEVVLSVQVRMVVRVVDLRWRALVSRG